MSGARVEKELFLAGLLWEIVIVVIINVALLIRKAVYFL